MSRKSKLSTELLENLDNAEENMPYFEENMANEAPKKKQKTTETKVKVESEKKSKEKEKEKEKLKEKEKEKEKESKKKKEEVVTLGYSTLPNGTVVTLQKEWDAYNAAVAKHVKGAKYTEYTVQSFKNNAYTLLSEDGDKLTGVLHKDIFILPMNDDQYYVDSIIERKYDAKLKTFLCKVRWTGYGPESDSWIPECDIDSGLVQDFKNSQKKIK